MTRPLKVLSSMATRRSLAEIAAAWTASTGREVENTSVGGVEAARRIRAGEAFDVAVLARDALVKLAADSFVRHETIGVVALSPTAVAVRPGAPQPTSMDVESVRRLMIEARAIGISSGPSGGHLRQLIEKWGLAEALMSRLVEAAPGVPVAHLIAGGDVDLGFQQLSELLGEPGIEIAGPLPAAILPLTSFAAGEGCRSADPAAADAFLAHLRSAEAQVVLARHGFLQPPAEGSAPFQGFG